MSDKDKKKGKPGQDGADYAARPGKKAGPAARGTLRELENEIEGLSEAAWVMNGERRILAANEAAARLLGRTAWEMIGRCCYELVHASGRPITDCPFERAVSTQRTEVSRFSEGGRSYEAVACPVADGEGRFNAMVHIQRTLAERGKAAPAAAVGTAVSADYLLLAAHDLRNQLHGMQGFTDFLRHDLARAAGLLRAEPHNKENSFAALGFIEGKGFESLEVLRESAIKSGRIVDTMLKVLGAGRLDIRPGTVDMPALVKEVRLALAFQIKETQAVIRVEALPACKSSPEVMGHILLNLIGNAMKYRAAGRRPEITVRGERRGAKVVYSVSDNGRGITKSDLLRVWRLFWSGAAPEVEKGQGLGLSISRHLAEACSGRLWAESEEKKGSVFFVEMPASPDAGG